MPLAKLPTEILNHILAEVLIPATVKHPQPSPSTNVMPAETSSTAAESTAPSAPQVAPAEEQVSVGALKAAHSLSVVSKAFCSGAHQHLRRHFHAFDSPVGNTIRIINRWIPRPDDRYRDFLKYWQHHAGSVWSDVADLRMQAMLFDKVRADLAVTIALDARVPNMAMTTNPYSWSMWNFPQWIASSTLLSRLSKPFTSLTHLHLRITAQSDIMLIVENILLLNPQLVDVVIEADTPLEMEFYTQPILRLDKTTSPDRVYADMARFVVRGPGLQIAATDSTHFFRRIRQCTTVCFAVRSIAAEDYPRTWQWTQQLLGSIPNVERAEISVADDIQSRTSLRDALLPCRLLNLVQLILDYGDVNCKILQELHAPRLSHIRIRSVVPIGKRGRCAPGHFPNLLCVTIYCPGPVIERFRMLGLARRQFIQNIREHMWYEDDYWGEVFCYIRKFVATEADNYKAAS
ncbi:hypothetical protein CF326_g7854 [Tilletia indica]|nr:hypothetical protein CF326_g7854 [Tilletia indica]